MQRFLIRLQGAPRSLAICFCLLSVTACIPTGEPSTPVIEPPTPLQSAVLATAAADQPAAGICAEPQSELVTITIYPDIPDPRCSVIRNGQRLMVINQRTGTIDVRLGSFAASLPPGEQLRIEEPFGSYLAPGVHRLEVSPCCGAELWLKQP